MATSGTSVLTVTRDDVIRQAMLNIGALDGDEVPTPRETLDCSLILNMLVKQWQGRSDFAPGLKTWKRRRSNLFLSTSSGQYTVGPSAVGWTESFVKTSLYSAASGGDSSIDLAIGPPPWVALGNYIGIQLASGDMQWTTVSLVDDTVVSLTDLLLGDASQGAPVYYYTTTANQPLNLEAVVLRDSNGNDLPLKIMTQQEFDSLPSKAAVGNQGDPTAVYYEFQRINSNLFIDSNGVVDVTRYLVLTYLEAVQSLINPLDELEYTQEWYLPLCWGLAKQIAPMFHMDFTQQMESVFTTSLSVAQHKEAEVSRMFFQGSE